MQRRILVVATVLFFVLLMLGTCLGCSKNDREYWPTAEWRTSSPRNQGMDSRKLMELAKDVPERFLLATSILVIRHGHVVFEQYYMGDQGTPRITWCVTKGVLSALVGIAIEEGHLRSVEQKMMEFFPEYNTHGTNLTINDVTIHHLLTMTGGSAYSEGEELSHEVFQRNPRNAPGSAFFYNDIGPDILSMIITKATGLKAFDFGNKHLFGPLGITNVAWPASTASGIGYNECNKIQLTTRDMAKLGYLYLKKGIWDNVQVIPAEWVAASTRDQLQSLDSRGNFYGYSMGYFDGYGYGWWVRAKEKIFSYAMVGMGGQIVCVLPDLDIVTVLTTVDSPANTPDYLAVIDDYIIPAVKH